MGKKIKLGTIKVTRKVTVTQQVRQQRHVDINPTYISNPPHINIQPIVSEIQKEARKLETAIKKAARPAKLPSGFYSPQVESLYEEINKRSKPEESEKEAMYDVFISHASEDKESFVNPLVEALQDAGIRVWYDALEMEWGKSLREQIDNGIKRSKYAIVVLSKNFFAKKWTNRELDGILAKEGVTGVAPLPIWYELTYEEVYNFSPTLSGLYSLSTDQHSITDICQSFKLVLEKEEIRSN